MFIYSRGSIIVDHYVVVETTNAEKSSIDIALTVDALLSGEETMMYESSIATVTSLMIVNQVTNVTGIFTFTEFFLLIGFFDFRCRNGKCMKTIYWQSCILHNCN